MIDPKQFDLLAAQLRQADALLAARQRDLDEARQACERAARHRNQCRTAIQALAEGAAGAKLWP